MTGEGDRPGWRRHAAVAVAALVVINILAQTVLFRQSLGEGDIASRMQPYTDAEDYMGRARRLAEGDGFSSVFRDGIRMPGYPLFLALFSAAGDDQARAVRIAQIVLSASIIALAYLCLSTLAPGGPLPLVGAVLAAFWLPFYYFSRVLYAETPSIICVALLCMLLSRFDPDRPLRILLPAAAVTAAAVYLKPNLAVLLPVLLTFAAFATARAGRPLGPVTLLAPVVLIAALVAPWTIFISAEQGRFVPLSTHGGWNLYLGSGGGNAYDKQWAEGSLPEKIWERLGLRDSGSASGEYDRVPATERAAADARMRRLAAQRWRAAPAKLTAYGIAKVLHSFGFSLRGPRDYAVALHFAAAMAASIVLWTRRRYREWALLLWAFAIVVAFQAFLFIGELRFKTVLFDFPALIVITLGIGSIIGTTGMAAALHAAKGR
jgi:hypothetical protein